MISYLDSSIECVSLRVTSFGSSDDVSGLMLFYDEGISDLPILMVNTSEVRAIRVEPLLWSDTSQQDILKTEGVIH